MTDCLTTPPAPAALASFPPDFGTRFVVTIDTEEEFDWAAPLTRDAHRTDAVPAIARFQQFCEGHGVSPCWLVDYPVATDPRAAEILNPALAAGRAELGLQLHPWVNPPFDEALTRANSFPGNLPPEIERAKLATLLAAVRERFAAPPLVYRAGRYGVGPNTAAMLAAAGLEIDSSVRPHFEYRALGGPDFTRLAPRPWWPAAPGALLEVPLTTVFTGRWRAHGPRLYPRVTPRWLRGIMARSGLLERVPLTPEGINVAEACRAIDAALADQLPVLVFAFHSPSLAPGHTPYVRDAAALDALYGWWRAVFAHLAAAGARPTTMRAVRDAARLASPAAAG